MKNYFKFALVALLSMGLCGGALAQSKPTVNANNVNADGNVKILGTLNIGKQPATGSVEVPVLDQLNREIYVDQFGAVGNNASTDAANIQKAIDYGSSIGGAKVKLVKGKTYLLNTPLLAKKGVTIEGECSTATNDTNPPLLVCSRLRAAANMSAVITQADMTLPVHSFGLVNVVIDGNKANFSVPSLIYVSLINGRFENNTIENGSGDCLFYDKNNLAAWVTWIRDNTIGGCTGYGLIFKGSDARIESNYISGNGNNVLIEATGAYAFTNNMLDNSTNGYGLEIKNAPILDQSLNTVVGNYFNNHKTADILVSKDATFPNISFRTTISANIFHASSVLGTGANIVIQPNIRDGLITGNVFSDSGPAHVKFETGVGNGNWQIIGNSHSGALATGSRIVNAPGSTQMSGGGSQGVFNRLSSMILSSSAANISIPDTQLNVYGNDTVLTQANVAARVGLSKGSAGFDAALLMGVEGGNAPFISAHDGEGTGALPGQLKFNSIVSMTWGATVNADGVPRKLKVYTVATLPACNSGLQDAMAAVSDATAPTYNGALAGGGAVRVPVFCNGSAWSAH